MLILSKEGSSRHPRAKLPNRYQCAAHQPPSGSMPPPPLLLEALGAAVTVPSTCNHTENRRLALVIVTPRIRAPLHHFSHVMRVYLFLALTQLLLGQSPVPKDAHLGHLHTMP